MYIYVFYLGDKYGDGHGKHEVFQYEMNITANEFNAALDKFNLEAKTNCLRWFQYYGAYTWKPDMKEALKKIGLNYLDFTDEIDDELDEDDPDYAAVLKRTTYINLMFNIVKHYVPHFEWKPYTIEKGPGHLCIDGKAYGLWE